MVQRMVWGFLWLSCVLRALLSASFRWAVLEGPWASPGVTQTAPTDLSLFLAHARGGLVPLSSYDLLRSLQSQGSFIALFYGSISRFSLNKERYNLPEVITVRLAYCL